MGQIIVIEGVDASGKETQTQMLYERLISTGKNVKKIYFPNYEDKSSLLAKKYLNGEFGKHADDVNPKVASSFFAVERYISYINSWGKFYEKDDALVLADRYVTSNMVHQAAKLSSNHEKDEFISWVKEFEYEQFQLPKPSKVFFLKLPMDIVFDIIKNRQNKIDGAYTKDIHECDNAYLMRSYETACYIAQKENWHIIDCANGNERKSREEINQEIFSVIENL